MAFILDIMLTLRGTAVPSGACNHGHCQLPPKLTSPNFRIEPGLYWPCSARHSFDGNAVPQSIIAFPVTIKDLMAPVVNQALKAGHVGFVTDTYIQCISSSL